MNRTDCSTSLAITCWCLFSLNVITFLFVQFIRFKSNTDLTETKHRPGVSHLPTSPAWWVRRAGRCPAPRPGSRTAAGTRSRGTARPRSEHRGRAAGSPRPGTRLLRWTTYLLRTLSLLPDNYTVWTYSLWFNVIKTAQSAETRVEEDSGCYFRVGHFRIWLGCL